MTVISDVVESVAGTGDDRVIVFAIKRVRQNVDGNAIVSTEHVQYTPVDGAFTTDDLDPGPATVKIHSQVYPITIPDSDTPVRLWPLIDAGLPAPAPTAGFVRNGGGVARIEWVTEAAYAALVKDPETTYITYIP